uniref:Uncharacterized protein n=1 Tax=Rhabditophanes sp. KR3021 TaxID=114890 RepID=A0AC35TQD7_9BILA
MANESVSNSSNLITHQNVNKTIAATVKPIVHLPIYIERFLAAGTSNQNNAMIDQSESVNINEFKRNTGELDMLIGFLLMNGSCIAFFIFFGLCVIFNCLRQRPKFLIQDRELLKKTFISTKPPPTTLPQQHVLTNSQPNLRVDVRPHKFKKFVLRAMACPGVRDNMEAVAACEEGRLLSSEPGTSHITSTDTPERTESTTVSDNERMIQESDIVNRNGVALKNTVTSYTIQSERGTFLSKLSQSFRLSRQKSTFTKQNGNRLSMNGAPQSNRSNSPQPNGTTTKTNQAPNLQPLHSPPSNQVNVIMVEMDPSIVRQNLLAGLTLDDLHYT